MSNAKVLGSITSCRPPVGAGRLQRAQSFLRVLSEGQRPGIDASLTTLEHLVRAKDWTIFSRMTEWADSAGVASFHVDMFDSPYVKTADGKDNMGFFNSDLVARIADLTQKPIHAHLMVRPARTSWLGGFVKYTEGLVNSGAELICVHWSAFEDDRISGLLGDTVASGLKTVSEAIRGRGACVGLAVDAPNDQNKQSRGIMRGPDLMEEFGELFDYSMIITGEAGAGGRGFDQGAFANLDHLRSIGYQGLVAADIGIKDTNILTLAQHGVMLPTVGSFLFNKDSSTLNDLAGIQGRMALLMQPFDGQ